MTVRTAKDPRQELPTPISRAIGFCDTKAQFDAIIRALTQAGYPESKIIALYGPDGLRLLDELRETFFFGDGEDGLVKFATRELEHGHYSMGIEVKDRDDALRVVNLAKPHGGHSFGYFGTWVNERLTK